jgi:serine/threonine protein kinase
VSCVCFVDSFRKNVACFMVGVLFYVALVARKNWRHTHRSRHSTHPTTHNRHIIIVIIILLHTILLSIDPITDKTIRVFAPRQEDELYIAMEYCDGGSTADVYAALERPFSEPQIAYIMRETLKCLQFMHRKHIIHRDMKAANILLTRDGQVKIIDFVRFCFFVVVFGHLFVVLFDVLHSLCVIDFICFTIIIIDVFYLSTVCLFFVFFLKKKSFNKILILLLLF